MESLVERYAGRIRGVLSCFDRMVVTGSIPDIGYADAMSGYLREHNIRIFDYPHFAEPLRDEIRANAEKVAATAGLQIEFIRRRNFRKEQRVREIVKERGEHPGLVHIFSAMESCPSFKPWHDKRTHRTYLRYTEAKCLHYYFYFIDKEVGLCYVRVPTWAPFRLQFGCNGHLWLAGQLRAANVDFQLVDNAFVHIEDFDIAQQLADELSVRRLHGLLNRAAKQYCPVISHFASGYHWSIMQLEYATDIVFRRRADLQPLYDELVRTAVHAVKAEDVAMFLGRPLDTRFKGELGTDFHTRIEGTRIKHHMGRVSIKMYDKLGVVLRIETTANDVSFFKHHRRVVHRDGTSEFKNAPVKKTIYSLPPLANLMGDANRRYLRFLSTLDDPSSGYGNLTRIGKRIHDGKRSHRGFNLFDGDDLLLFEALVRGEYHISGFRNRDLQQILTKSPGQISRLLGRLRTHRLVKKIHGTYKYYFTSLGRRVVVAALKLRRFLVIPTLAYQHA